MAEMVIGVDIVPDWNIIKLLKIYIRSVKLTHHELTMLTSYSDELSIFIYDYDCMSEYYIAFEILEL